jgi:hypothetical protein
MTRFNKKRFLTMLTLFLVAIPNYVLAQIDPPPAAPVKDYNNLFIIAMFVFLFCFFCYKEYISNNLKKTTK